MTGIGLLNWIVINLAIAACAALSIREHLRREPWTREYRRCANVGRIGGILFAVSAEFQFMPLPLHLPLHSWLGSTYFTLLRIAGLAATVGMIGWITSLLGRRYLESEGRKLVETVDIAPADASFDADVWPPAPKN